MKPKLEYTTLARAHRLVACSGTALALGLAPGDVHGEYLPAAQATAIPQADKRLWALTSRWENDAFAGSDRYYSNGVLLSLTHTGSSWLDSLADRLPWGEGRRTVGYDLAQIVITPSDTGRSVPDPLDRPYAGVFSAGVTLHVENENACQSLRVCAGLVGPGSLAERTQRDVHRLLGFGHPLGWDYQLRNEPVFDIAFEYRHRFALAGRRERWSVEGLPMAGAWLGNLITQGQASGYLRVGYNMPDDFGPTLIRGLGTLPPPRLDESRPLSSAWGFSFFGGVQGSLVLRDITLDGNTFRDSRRVEKETLVPAAGVGVTVGCRHFQTSFAYVFWGKEFKGQAAYSAFGTVAMTYLF